MRTTLARPNRFLYLLVFAVGMASLGAEIAAARLMAPFFGASTIVWANTIGVVLVALSIGYWLGGRIGDRHPHLRGLCLLVLGAAVLVAAIPFVAQPFLDVSVDALDEISAGAFVGSLIGVLFLIAVPVILLGACSPYAIRLAIPDVEHAGSVAGRLYAVSTAGSLLGTLAGGPAADPADRDPAHLPRLRGPDRAGRRRRAGVALRRRPGGARRRDRAAGRDGQGKRRGAMSSTRPTPSTSTRGSSRSPTATACSSSTRARRCTRSTGRGPTSPATSGTGT